MIALNVDSINNIIKANAGLDFLYRDLMAVFSTLVRHRSGSRGGMRPRY